MALSSRRVSQSSQSSSEQPSFKCCKSKSFTHYICVECLSVIHKCCIPKFRNKIRFIKENKIVCCKLDDSFPIEEDEEKSILENTISELNEDSIAKNKHINRLKEENKLLLDEAIKAETEMSQLIRNQEKIIQELNLQIVELKKQTQTTKKIFKNNTTQTEKKVKHITTSTDLTMENLNMNILNNKWIQNEQTVQITNEIHGKQILDNTQHSRKHGKNNTRKIDKHRKNQILLLVDDTGRNIVKQLRREFSNSYAYEILSVVKPGAMLHQVIECVEILTKDFTLQDYVVITAGSNDINCHKTPSFKLICNKLKQCSHTNVIFTSIPYLLNKQNNLPNRHIFKYNNRLNNFLTKFNNLVPGHISYVEINSEINNKTKQCTNAVAAQIKNVMLNKGAVVKKLIFVTLNENLPLQDAPPAQNVPVDSSVEIIQESMETSCDMDSSVEILQENMDMLPNQNINVMSRSQIEINQLFRK